MVHSYTGLHFVMFLRTSCKYYYEEMFQKHTWVCSLCGQGLTRKSSAIRHNNNLHAGQAEVVRPYEYIIGRLNGNFHRPKDPLTYRHRKESTLLEESVNRNDNGFMSKVIADSTQHLPTANNVSAPFTVSIQSTSPPKTGDNRLSSSLDCTEMIRQRGKLEEFSLLAYRHYPPDNARVIVAITAAYLFNYGDEKFLDERLEWLRKADRMRFGSTQAIYFNNNTNYSMPYTKLY